MKNDSYMGRPTAYLISAITGIDEKRAGELMDISATTQEEFVAAGATEREAEAMSALSAYTDIIIAREVDDGEDIRYDENS
jgi:hypothetical protein